MTDNQFFGNLQDHFDKSLPFVAYRKPNLNEVNAFLQSDNRVYKTINFQEKGFIFSPFNNLDDTILIPLEKSEKINLLFNFSNIEKLSDLVKNEDSLQKQQHIILIKQGIEAIKQKAFKKVVLSRKEIIDIENRNTIDVFKNLLKTYKSAFVYCWYHPRIGLWLGATPETLIKIEGKRFSIMALAGTQEFKGSLDVTWRQKEVHEQKVVTDFIVENLKPLVENSNISETVTVKAGNLLHLKTIVTAKLKRNSTLTDLISALHPTPAVCGYPKNKAKQFILENENYNREFYTGFLGELNLENNRSPRTSKRNIENRAYTVIKKSTQLYVNLRCMQIKDKQALIYIGGGITETSNPEKEWEETVSKSLVIKSVLN